MPHVDDGTLHAYLDGAVDALAEAGALPDGVTRGSIDAHFAACADCRSRLDAERDIRERAGLVLRDAAPAYAPPPPFTATAPRARRPWVPLSWAATVLLAIGAGWWGRDIVGTAQLDAPPMRTESEVPGTAPAATTDAELQQAPTATTVNPGAEAPPPSAGSGATGDVAAARNRVAPQAEVPPAVAPQVARTESKPAQEQRAAQDALVTADRDVADSAARVQQLAAPGQANRAQDLARRSFQAGAPAAAPAPPPRVLAPEPPLRALVIGTRADTVRWQLVRDPQRTGVRGLRLAGAGDPVVRTAPVIGYELVKVEQRLDTGEMVEVVTAEVSRVALDNIVVTGSVQRGDTLRQESAAAAPAAAAAVPSVAVASAQTTALADGTSEVLLQTADGRVVALRGRVDMARLRRLADTLVPLR